MYKNFKNPEIAHNKNMMCIGSLLAGFINGLFASGAGQIIVFLFIYILGIETHKARATSVFLMGIVTIITIIRYMMFVDLKLSHVITAIATGLVFGVWGSKIMKKIKSEYLNLISGILVAGFAIYSLIRG